MAEASEEDPANKSPSFHAGLDRHDAGFPADAGGRMPFEPWTQFSGMTHPVSPSHLYWENFVQPSDPVDGQFGLSTSSPDYFSAYSSYVQDLGRTGGLPGFDDASSLGSDFPASPPFPEDSGYDTASKEGYDLYTDAMKQWQTRDKFTGTYNPFGTTDVLTQAKVPEEKADINSKPKTYSDVAKTLKSKPMQKPKEDLDNCSKKKVPDTLPKSFKPAVKKSFQTRGFPSRQRTTSADGNQGSIVLPDSKYGLDQFEDLDGFEAKVDKPISSSAESLSHRSRKGSNSSVSSGTSGIEEIHLTKSTSRDSMEKNTSEKLNTDPGKASNEHVPPSKDKTDRVFFDPKRIFQKKEKDTNKVKNDSRHSGASKSAGTVLNNGKPPSASKTSCVPPKKADYINNDLRDSKKRTNHTAAMNRESRSKGHSEEDLFQNGVSPERKSRKDVPSRHDAESQRHLPFGGNIDWELIDEWVSFLGERCKSGLHRTVSILLTLLLYLLGIIMYLASGSVHLISLAWSKGWCFIKAKVFKNNLKPGTIPGTTETAKRRTGLEENISLPSTGEEAMRRLLACRGKDPYSILGLRSDSSDEDIKKYYRRQAVLVHPDKNQEPGAEEAFKILGHAFEMIREPAKRKVYDAQMQEAHEAEAAMREFNDLLTKLHEKIQEAANMMRCDNCGGKHKRIPVDRPWYSARFCDRCNNFHSAKEGDVWAEKKMLGFLWHYYACMDQHVYDITEWVACHKEFFKQMQANSHHVFYRIATDGNRGHRHGKSGEHDLEDFINHLFHKASMSPDGSSPWQQQQQQQQQQSSQQPQASSAWGAGSSTTSAAGGKRARRKKKRH
ncbi:uncharacterized protein LOC124113072 [Haliotis rufescens]|uniref:uncharacterized protein LOC124113072 n=1 Tax=Haliotis rufescens TaxID=6454 RepID=UPI001EAFCCB4|nr:uncharacterized protein LOC124113072 [Haliotis rufescens]